MFNKPIDLYHFNCNFQYLHLVMKKAVFLFIFFCAIALKAKPTGKADTLYIFYLENYPYSYSRNDSIKGIEIESRG